MDSVTERTFEFSKHIAITLSCRSPPEAQAGRTLTWQIGDDSKNRHASAVADLIGLDLWPAALALCEYLLENRNLVLGKDVVELGSGMGLVGLLAAKLGSSSVLLTDYELQVLERTQQNVARNGVAVQCRTVLLDWTRLSSLEQRLQCSCTVVLAADVLYVSCVAQPLCNTLVALLHPDGMALVGHQVRRAVVLDRQTQLPRLEEHDEPLERFKAACSAAGLCVRTLSRQESCSNLDADPMLLLAVGWRQERLDVLPGT